jgi:hypothetical protein
VLPNSYSMLGPFKYIKTCVYEICSIHY